MKIAIIALSFVLLASVVSFSQINSLNLKNLNNNLEQSTILNSEKLPLNINASKKGSTDINLGLGYGVAGMYGNAGFPPISAGIQFSVDKSISIGAIIGYSTSSYDFPSISFTYPYTSKTYTWKYTYIMVGLRGEYHFLKDSKDVDAYVGATLGYNAVSFSDNAGGKTIMGYAPGAGYVLYGGHIGIKYLFSPSIGVFSELGYGLGYFTGGLTFRL